MSKKKDRWISTIAAYTMYLLTGASCLMVGSTLPQLQQHFGIGLAATTALGSAFALGRVITVFGVGYLTEKIGPKRVLAGGLVLLLVFLAGLPLTKSYGIALLVCALGGAGMGTQDAACPVLLMWGHPGSYASALSAGQAFFGAGCFLPPLVMGLVLRTQLPFETTYFIFAALALLSLGIVPFLKSGGQHPAGRKDNRPQSRQNKFSRKASLMMLCFASICICYCAATNTINLYTVSFVMSQGFKEQNAMTVLTLYNIGSMLGAFLFAGILRRAQPLQILCLNLLAALLCMSANIFHLGLGAIMVGYFVSGLFLGVLFSVVVTLAVGLAPHKASRAAAVVAMLSGGADIVSPLLTGNIITTRGLGFSLIYILIMLAAALVAALLFWSKTKIAQHQASGSKSS